MTRFINFVLVVLCVASLAAIGCRSLVDRVTPCDLPDAAAVYADIDPSVDWVSLYKAQEIRTGIFVKHRTEQLSFRRAAEDDKSQFQDAIAVIDPAIKEAAELQAMVVGSETQPLSILGIIAGLTGGTFLGGRLIQRKEDYNEDEHQKELAKAEAAAYERGLLAAIKDDAV